MAISLCEVVRTFLYISALLFEEQSIRHKYFQVIHLRDQSHFSFPLRNQFSLFKNTFANLEFSFIFLFALFNTAFEF